MGAEREFSVDDGAAECAFGGVVGRLDVRVGGEGPERGPDLEQVGGELSVPAVALPLGRGLFEQVAEFGLDLGDLGLESVAVVVLVLVGAPGGCGVSEFAIERPAVSTQRWGLGARWLYG